MKGSLVAALTPDPAFNADLKRRAFGRAGGAG
jgi:hypothetical protein